MTTQVTLGELWREIIVQIGGSPTADITTYHAILTEFGNALAAFSGIGSLSGDVTGPITATVLSKIQGVTITSFSGATAGEVMTYNGTTLGLAAATSAPTGTAGGDLGGTYPNPTLTASGNVDSIIATNPVVAGALQTTGGTMSGNIAMGTHKVSGLATATTSGDAMGYGYNIASGDLTGPIQAPTIEYLRGVPLGVTSGITTGQTLVYQGGQLVPGPAQSVANSGVVSPGQLQLSGTVASSVTNTTLANQYSTDGAAEELSGAGPNPAVWGLKFNTGSTTAGSGLFFIGWIFGGGSPLSSGDFTLPSGWSFISSWTDGTYYTYFCCAATNHASVSSSTTLTFTVNTGAAVYGAAKVVAVPGLGSQTLILDGTPTATVQAGTSLASVTSGGLSGLTGTNDILFTIVASTSASPDFTAASMAGFQSLPVWVGATYGSPGASFVAESMGNGAVPPTVVNFTANATTEAGCGMVAISFSYTSGGGGTYVLDLPTSPTNYPALLATNPTFYDNFAGTVLNSSKWNSTYQGTGGGVVGVASTSAANVTVNNGVQLKLSSTGGNAYNSNLDSGVGACIDTHGKFSFNQGYVQAVMTLPSDGTGHIANWGGLYTAVYNFISGVCNEIDVNETLNVAGSADGSENAAPRTSVHSYSGGAETTPYSVTPSGSYGGVSTTFGMLWYQNTITFFIGGAVVGSTTASYIGSGTPVHEIYLCEGQAEIYAGLSVVNAYILVSQIAYWPLL